MEFGNCLHNQLNLEVHNFIQHSYSLVNGGIKSCQIKQFDISRDDIIKLLPSDMTITELGVDCGDYSKKLLSTNPQHLTLIDIWRNMANADHINPEWEQHYEMVKEKFNQNPNVSIIRSLTIDGIEQIQHQDMFYIDADHSYQSVLKDIIHSDKKLKSGGIMMGHDYCVQHKPNFGVVQAIWEFLDNHKNYNLLGITQERFATWIMIKN